MWLYFKHGDCNRYQIWVCIFGSPPLACSTECAGRHASHWRIIIIVNWKASTIDYCIKNRVGRNCQKRTYRICKWAVCFCGLNRVTLFWDDIQLFFEKWLSVAKLEARSEASRQKLKFTTFWREASLRALRFATLSNFKRICSGQLIGHFTRPG